MSVAEFVYFAVTAYDTQGNESSYSEEVVLYEESQSQLFFLMDNYPNPFNPVTSIPYVLPKRLYISLIVYDLLGRQIKILEKGEKSAGQYTAQWDGTDKRGKQVSNGVYIVRMVVGSFALSKKLILSR
jgi:hypothetical protein